MNLSDLTPKERRDALQALLDSTGWQIFTKEAATRLEKSRREALDLGRKGRLRAGSAGAANELESLIAYVPSAISSLDSKLQEQKKRGRIGNPAVSG